MLHNNFSINVVTKVKFLALPLLDTKGAIESPSLWVMDHLQTPHRSQRLKLLALCCAYSFNRCDSVTSWTVACQEPLSMAILQARMLEWVAMASFRGPSQPRDCTQAFALQADSLLSESPGKPKNIVAGSLSLLQGNFLTQELNQGSLHCRWILYQLKYQHYCR